MLAIDTHKFNKFNNLVITLLQNGHITVQLALRSSSSYALILKTVKRI